MSKSKPKTTPKPNPKQANPNNTELQYQRGNGEFLAVQLLTLVCNKLDVIRNHTQVQVELLQKISDNQEELLNRIKAEDEQGAEDI